MKSNGQLASRSAGIPLNSYGGPRRRLGPSSENVRITASCTTRTTSTNGNVAHSVTTEHWPIAQAPRAFRHRRVQFT